MPEIEMSEKTRQARDRLRQTLKENPTYAKAFKETIDELRKPENIKSMSRDICVGLNAIKMAIEYAKRSKAENERTEIR